MIKRLLFSLFFIVAHCCLLPAEETVTQTIQQLSNDRYAIREAATKSLVRQGLKSVPDMLASYPAANLETKIRIANSLYAIGFHSDKADFQLLLRGMRILSKSGQPRIERNIAMLTKQRHNARSLIAIEKLSKLGATIQKPGLDPLHLELAQTTFVDENGQAAKEHPDPKETDKDLKYSAEQFKQHIAKFRNAVNKRVAENKQEMSSKQAESLLELVYDRNSDSEPEILVIVIDKKTWTGKKEDLNLLASVVGLYTARITDFEITEEVFAGLSRPVSPFSLELFHCNYDLVKLKKFTAHSMVSVITVGKGMLGIRALSTKKETKGCTVSEVVDGTGAALGGILAGDIITEIDGTSVTDFASLTYIIASRKASEEVKVKVIRNKDEHEYNIKLQPRLGR